MFAASATTSSGLIGFLRLASRSARHIVLLSTLGLPSVAVNPTPRVAVLSTGDELLDAPYSLAAGQIYDSNRPMLSLILEGAGSDVTDLGIVRDDPDQLLATLVSAAADHDLIISSGGASAGFADHLTHAVSQSGRLEFWKLDTRPGKPIGFGDIDHCPILILPGNPLAAAAGWAVLGRAIVHRLAGCNTEFGSRLRRPISKPFLKPLGRTQILLGCLSADKTSGATIIDPLAERGSASVLSLSHATHLIVLNNNQGDVNTGDVVDVMPLWQA